MYDFVDMCPHCGEQGLPKLHPESLATAVSCQKCGYISEIDAALAAKQAKEPV